MKIMADQLKREGQILAHYYRRIYKLEKEIPSNY
jgi:hypothetical protein